jgi:hypothetical protein
MPGRHWWQQMFHNTASHTNQLLHSCIFLLFNSSMMALLRWHQLLHLLCCTLRTTPSARAHDCNPCFLVYISFQVQNLLYCSLSR